MKGKRLSVDGLSLFYARNEIQGTRVGISVSKRFANAVERNRLRRRIRASLMRYLDNDLSGYDLVFVARRELYSAPFERIIAIVETALQRAALSSTKN
jgi:ribonuclease P protein component